MAPSSIRSGVGNKSAYEIKKKTRRLNYLISELESEATVFKTRYNRIHREATTCVNNANALCFVEKLDGVADILEEGLQKLCECNIVFDIGDDTDDCDFDGDPARSPNSSTTCILDQSVPEKQEEDSDRSQCTVLIPIPVQIQTAERESKENDVDEVVAEKQTLSLNTGEEFINDEKADVVDSQQETPPLVEIEEVEHREPEEEKAGPVEGLVTHYVNPSEFYIIVDEELIFAAELRLIVKRYVEMGKPKTCAVVPKVGEMFAYYNDEMLSWMRVKILSVEDGNSVTAKLADFGSDVTVPVEELVEMPEKLVRLPMLANRCSLYNVIPVGDEWSEVCIKEMSRMILGSVGIRASLRVHGDQVLFVDLLKNCKCDGEDLKVNIGDYLVWRGLARYADVNAEEVIPPKEVIAPQPVSFKITSRATVKPAGCLSESDCSEYDCSFEAPPQAATAKKVEVEDVQGAIEKEQQEPGKMTNGQREVAESKNPCVSNGDVGRGEDPKKGIVYFGKPDVTVATVTFPCEPYGHFDASVAHVNTPGDFYIYFTMDSVLKGMKDIDGMLEKLVENKMAAGLKEENKRFKFTAGLYCCAKLSSGEWCRCEIVDGNCNSASDQRRDFVKVHALDIGLEEFVNVEDVRPMTRAMSKLPAFAVKCSLGGIHPIDKESQQWTEESGEEMKRLCPADKIFFVNLLSRSDDGTLSILLWDMNDGGDTIINEELFNVGLAASDIFTMDASGNGEDDCNNWDPMADDYLSERNRYDVDFDDAEMAVTSYKRHDESLICHFYQRGLVCKRGNSCRFKHIAPFGRVTTDTKEVLGGDINAKNLEVNDVAVVTVTAMFNPNQFFVNVVEERDGSDEDSKEYVLLFYALQEHCRKTKKRQTDLTMRANGEVVAAIFSDGFWYRARVIDINDKYHRVKVVYVDSGNSGWVSEDDTRDLPLEFYHCPLQAVMCNMPDIEPLSGTEQPSGRWSNAACKHFSNLVSDKDLYAYVTSKGPDGTLSVDLYDTRSHSAQTVAEKMIDAGFAQRKSP